MHQGDTKIFQAKKKNFVNRTNSYAVDVTDTKIKKKLKIHLCKTNSFFASLRI